MRTNIVIDNNLMTRARELSGLTTKRAIVEEALQLLITHYEQLQVRRLRGQLRWEGDLNAMREDKDAPSR